MKSILWAGRSVSSDQLPTLLAGFAGVLRQARPRLIAESVLTAAERMARALRSDEIWRARLIACLDASDDASATLEELAVFLSREELARKLARELAAGDGAAKPLSLARPDARECVFETWAPVGLVVHIAPTNAANVPFLSVIEGLLVGNVNFLKTGGEDSGYPQSCLEMLIAMDSTDTLAPHVYAANVSSRQRDLLRLMLAEADAVAVWGAEEALAGIRELAPPHARLVEWGPKISFAYVERAALREPGVHEAIANDVCAFEQQACSSPQVIYVDTESDDELLAFGEAFGQTLARVSASRPRTRVPSRVEEAERTKVDRLARCEQSLPQPPILRVFGGPDFRVYVDRNPGLRASPLYRTVWLKRLPQQDLRRVLHPMRHYLQTVGLAAGPSAIARLSRELFSCGVLRVTSVGEMLAGYSGEPHDGVYALQRYARRVSVRLTGADAGKVAGVRDLDALLPTPSSRRPEGPLMDKDDFQRQHIADRDAELYFKSGGSSGAPKLSVFTYDDYHAHMRAAADGLLAAGLTPERDRCLNLFFGGGLYGGFLSFFTILESLKAVQFPMAAHGELDFVAETIVRQRVNVLLGMPSYLMRLFEEQGECLRGARIEKIFYGGEHFSAAQADFFRDKFGVEIIRSAAYGGNDCGPMGYQCAHCRGGEHHLHDHQILEILERDTDQPAAPGAIGRLVFTVKYRRGQRIQRYEVGDLGRWTADYRRCPCGRTAPKFELLGRHGDVFRAGGMFFNYRKFASLLPGELQFVIEKGLSEKVTLRYAYLDGWQPERVRDVCLESYPELQEAVIQEKAFEFACEPVAGDALERTPGSGKLRSIIDRRG